MTYDCASAPMPDIIDRLKEHAEWAEANIYEVPITLPDDITEAIKEIEQLVKERDEYRKMSLIQADLMGDAFGIINELRIERDAAFQYVPHICKTCQRKQEMYLKDGRLDALCDTCRRNHRCNWKWRGVQEEEHETH